MLRKLFGLPPDPSPRRAAEPSSPGVPRRRKPVFEALENRLLLSADPLGALAENGVLSLVLGDGDDAALVERVGAAQSGGDIVAVTLGAVTQRYGDPFLGIFRLLIDAGAGDDWLRLLGVTARTEIIGGLGTDTLAWQGGDATWSITARDTGQVGTASFSSFEHLAGGADTRDAFLFAAGATVSGGVDGGAGGGDSLVIQGGEYQRITYAAAGAGEGAIALDDRTIAYAGIEPVTLGATAAVLELNAGAGADVARLRDDAQPGVTVLESLTGSFADVAFANPTASLTIDLGGDDDRITIATRDGGFAAALAVSGGDGRDRIDFAGTVATGGHDLVAAAETIVVAAGSVLRTDSRAGGADGDLVLAAAASDATGAADASVTITGGTLIGGNVAISASAAFTVAGTPGDARAAAAVTIDGGAEVAAAGTLTIDVRALVAAAEATDGAAAVRSAAAARIGGAATLTAGDDIEIGVANRIDRAAAQATGATIALETTALVADRATLAAREVRLHAASDDAGWDLAGIAAAADFASVTRAAVAADAGVHAVGAVLIVAASLDVVEQRSYGEAVIGLHPEVDAGPAGRDDDARAAAPGSDDRWFGAADGAAAGPDAAAYAEGFAADPRPAASGRPLPEAAEPAAVVAALAPDAWGEDEAGVPVDAVELIALPPIAGALVAASVIAGRSDAPAPLPAPVAEADPDEGRGDRSAERDDDADDGGLGASLVLSVLKESAFAELARSVASGGGAVVLAAGGAPFGRARARGGPEAADADAAGALALGDDDRGAAVIVAGPADAALDAALVAAGDLVLATTARHDLIGEARGGAEPGTAVTGVAVIDFSGDDEAALEAEGATLTRVAPADRVEAPDGEAVRLESAGGIAGLVLSIGAPPIAIDYFVGDDAREAGAIRSADGAGAPVTAGAIVVSGVLDPARVPPAAPGSGHDVNDLRDGAIACLGALAAPLAASAGLPRDARRRDGDDRARRAGAGPAGRTAFGADAVRAGGAWAERFVNELGLAPEDAHPNAKIKLKI